MEDQEDNRPAYPDGKIKEFDDSYFDDLMDDEDEEEESEPHRQTYEEYVDEQLRIEKKLQ